MSERLKLICPECKVELRVATEHAGKRSKCPKCQAVVSVPAAEHESRPPAPPLTVDSPNPQRPRQTEIQIVKAQYTPPLVVIAVGVLICVAGTRSPVFLFIGPAVISCGLWFAAHLWVNAFFTNALALLRRIANRGDQG